MPHCRTLKSLFVEIIMFVGTFALVGHLSMNFWERFIIQTELSNMKISLYSLKETIHKIGNAYDNLHRQLTGLAEETEKKKSTATIIKEKPQAKRVKQDHAAIRRAAALYDKQIQTMIKAKIHSTTNPSVQNLVPYWTNHANKNVSTITRYPLKSTGVSLDSEKRNNSDNYCKHNTKSNNHIHKCCNDYECYVPNYSWKF